MIDLDRQLDILSFHLIITSIMVGVIWVIQLVHYPSFKFISRDTYISFQSFHVRRISIIVVPLMIVELITGFLLLVDNGFSENILLFSFLLLLIIWIITALFFSRIHKKLSSGFIEELINKLVFLNWIRTILWSIRLALICYYLLII